MPETKRTLRLASSSSEKEVENETSGEASSSGEKEKTITEVIGDDPNEILYPNLIEESWQATEVEEGEVSEATKSESETGDNWLWTVGRSGKKSYPW